MPIKQSCKGTHIAFMLGLPVGVTVSVAQDYTGLSGDIGLSGGGMVSIQFQSQDQLKIWFGKAIATAYTDGLKAGKQNALLDTQKKARELFCDIFGQGMDK